MSNVWNTRHRLLLEQFERLAKQLSDDDPSEPTALKEQTLRLLAAAVALLSRSAHNHHRIVPAPREALRDGIVVVGSARQTVEIIN